MAAVYRYKLKSYDSSILWEGNRFLSLRLTPKNKFKRILRIEDIIGREFSGVIMYADQWECDSSITDAIEELKIRQPE